MPRPQAAVRGYCITPFTSLGDAKELPAAADFVALQRNLQPVWRVLRAKAVLLPRKSPIKTVGQLIRISFLGKKVPHALIEPEFRAEIALRRGLRGRAIERSTGPRFFDGVIV